MPRIVDVYLTCPIDDCDEERPHSAATQRRFGRSRAVALAPDGRARHIPARRSRGRSRTVEGGAMSGHTITVTTGPDRDRDYRIICTAGHCGWIECRATDKNPLAHRGWSNDTCCGGVFVVPGSLGNTHCHPDCGYDERVFHGQVHEYVWNIGWCVEYGGCAVDDSSGWDELAEDVFYDRPDGTYQVTVDWYEDGIESLAVIA